MEDNSIEVAKHYEIMREELLRPSVKYQIALNISKDGDKYCVLLGQNLVEGVAGFGDTLHKAMNDFDTRFSS
jgi:hypothetical protein